MTDPRRRPTDSELAILRVLWSRGPSTVREVQENLDGAGYTTALKLLQIMQEKGLVTRDESQRAHRYSAAVSEDQTQRRLLGDLVDKAFGGSPAKLVQKALSSERASQEEIDEIRRLIADWQDGPGSPAGENPEERT